jgi:hypothetical protein
MQLQKSPSHSPNKGAQGGKSPKKTNTFPTTPRGQSKQKNILLINLKKLMEHNFRLSAQN